MSKLSVRYRCSFVSNALAFELVKSLPSKKSWDKAMWTNTFSWYAVLILFDPSKCRMMSADPSMGWASPVHDISAIFFLSLVFQCARVGVVCRTLNVWWPFWCIRCCGVWVVCTLTHLLCFLVKRVWCPQKLGLGFGIHLKWIFLHFWWFDVEYSLR